LAASRIGAGGGQNQAGSVDTMQIPSEQRIVPSSNGALLRSCGSGVGMQVGPSFENERYAQQRVRAPDESTVFTVGRLTRQ